MGRWGLGLAVFIIIVLVSVVPLRIAHLGALRPSFMLMAVYYWSLLRPSPTLVVFAIGLLLDLLSAYPFGMNALVLVAVQALTSGQRKFLMGQSFLVIWAGFAVVAFCAGFVQWALFSLFETSWVTPYPILIGTLLSAVLFPVVVPPLAAVHKMITGPLALS